MKSFSKKGETPRLYSWHPLSSGRILLCRMSSFSAEYARSPTRKQDYTQQLFLSISRSIHNLNRTSHIRDASLHIKGSITGVILGLYTVVIQQPFVIFLLFNMECVKLQVVI